MDTTLPLDTRIDWTVPEPRSGTLGRWDRFIGTGASTAEAVLVLAVTLLGAAAIVAYGLLGPAHWSPLQIVALAVVGADVLGGAVANASSATKRWYHRPGQGLRQHLAFTSLHVGYLAVIGWLFQGRGAVEYVLGASVGLLASALAVLRAPLYLRRPIAAALTVGAAIAGAFTGPPRAGLVPTGALDQADRGARRP
jgi:hypothetical protein